MNELPDLLSRMTVAMAIAVHGAKDARAAALDRAFRYLYEISERLLAVEKALLEQRREQ